MKISSFDKEKFTKILSKIKLQFQNQRDFASTLEVNRTYLMEFVNCKHDSPPSRKILKRIADNSNGITTYEELLDICGYVKSINDIKYILDKDNKTEIVKIKSDKEEKILILEQGEFLLLFLNANFLNEESSNKTFFNFFSKEISNLLKSFNTVDELLDFQYRLRNCINVVFDYKAYTKAYEDQFKDYISNTKINMSIANQKKGIEVLFDEEVIIPNTIKEENKSLRNFNNIQDIFMVNSIPQLLYIMLKSFTIFRTLPIRKCKNCNKYFIAKKRKDELYCDDLFESTNKTCRQLGAMTTYKQKLAENKAIALYKNIIKRKYMRVKRNPEDKKLDKDFIEWKNKAKLKFEKYKNNEITDNEFILFLLSDV